MECAHGRRIKMAEFRKILSEWSRMCKYYDSIDSDDPCKHCPMDPNQCHAVFENDEENDYSYQYIENVVMEWSKAHPAPQYPTWYQWLDSQGLIQVNIERGKEVGNYTTRACFTSKAFTPMPEDLAKKIGLESIKI